MDDLMCWCCGWYGPDVAVVGSVQLCVLCLDEPHTHDDDEKENNFLDEMIEFYGEG